MMFENIKKGIFLIFRIKQDLTLYSDLSALHEAVKNSLQAGEKNIAFHFTADSYFSSASVSSLVSCFEAIKDSRGRAAIVNPNHGLLSVLSTIDADSEVEILESEKNI